jgi:putative iron-regulated protein
MSHWLDGIGIRNVYLGRYERIDGSIVEGPSLSALVAAKAPEVDLQLRGELDASVAALAAIKTAAEGGMAYDQMLAPGNAEGEALIQTAVEALVTQTRSIERAVDALGLAGVTIEGSDSLDSPEAVFQ